jgi:mono/diheme cytochrome c family protein
MRMKCVLALLIVMVIRPLGILAQQPTTRETSSVPVDVAQWTRTAWGMDAKVLGFTDTEFLLSLSDDERQGAFLFKQRCNTCHYSTLTSTRGARAGLSTGASYGPPLTRGIIEGREGAARQKIWEGSATMPAFKYALQPEHIDLVISYLKKVNTVRPPVLDRPAEMPSASEK